MQPILNINLLVTNSKHHIIAAKFKIDNTKKLSEKFYIRCCVNVSTSVYAFLCTQEFLTPVVINLFVRFAGKLTTLHSVQTGSRAH
jgi:hypothetical protein